MRLGALLSTRHSRSSLPSHFIPWLNSKSFHSLLFLGFPFFVARPTRVKTMELSRTLFNSSFGCDLIAHGKCEDSLPSYILRSCQLAACPKAPLEVCDQSQLPASQIHWESLKFLLVRFSTSTLKLMTYKHKSIIHSKGLWRRFINVNIKILNVIHRNFNANMTIRKLIFVSVIRGTLLRWARQKELVPVDGPDRRQRLALSIRPNWVGSPWRRRQNPVSETSCFQLKDRTMQGTVHQGN
jgi:hypothetical protein